MPSVTTSSASGGTAIAAASGCSRPRSKPGAQTTWRLSRTRWRNAAYPHASNVSGTPLRSRRPSEISATSARWKPSIGTYAARTPPRSDSATSRSAYVVLPAPGAPAMPMIRRLMGQVWLSDRRRTDLATLASAPTGGSRTRVCA